MSKRRETLLDISHHSSETPAGNTAKYKVALSGGIWLESIGATSIVANNLGWANIQALARGRAYFNRTLKTKSPALARLTPA